MSTDKTSREAQQVAVPQVTDAMVTAYLKANSDYWKSTDAMPPKDPSRWRQGTPSDATREALRAALAMIPQVPQCVTCLRCGHDNWIQDGKADCDVKPPQGEKT